MLEGLLLHYTQKIIKSVLIFSFILILLSSFVFSFQNDSVTASYSVTGNNFVGFLGLKIVPNKDLEAITGCLGTFSGSNANPDAQFIELLASDFSTVLATASQNSTYHWDPLSTESSCYEWLTYNLTAGVSYYLVTNSSGATSQFRDDFSMTFPQALTDVDVTAGRYQGGADSTTRGHQFGFILTEKIPTKKVNLQAKNLHTNVTLTNFTVTLSNGSSYTNETGSQIIFYNMSGIYNATWEKTGYFNYTQEIDLNKTETITAYLNPETTEIEFLNITRDIYQNTTILNYTINFYDQTSGYGWNLSTTNGSLGLVYTIHPDNTTHDGLHFNHTFNLTTYATHTNGIIYFVQSKSYTVPDNPTNYTDIFYMNLTQARFVINDRLKTIATNSTILSFNATFDSYNSSESETYSTTDGNLTAYLNWSETFEITFKPDGYEFKSINQTMSDNVNYTTYIYFYRINTIILNFYDTQTLSLLVGTNVTVQFIGDTAQTNYTNTSQLIVDIFSPSEYTILFSADGYRQGQYSFTLVNGSSNEFNLYMEYTNATSLILITVTDKFGTVLQNAKVIKQKWINNSWITDEILLTDFQGRTEAYYVISTQFYNHVIQYEDITYLGIINDDTNKKLIFTEDVTNGINFKIDILGGSNLAFYQQLYDVEYNLTYTNTSNSTGYFRLAWNQINGLSVLANLKLYNNTESVAQCDTSTNSASGIMYCYVNVTTGLYKFTANAFFDSIYGGTEVVYVGDKETIGWKNIGYFLTAILYIVCIFLFLDSPSLALYVGTGIVTMCGLLGLIFRDIGFGFYVVLFVITYLIASIKSESGVNV